MNKRKTTGLVCIVAGIALIFLSRNIEGQVGEGRARIQRGQSQVNTLDSVFSSNEYTRGVGQAVTESGQRKINQGIMEANYYEGVAFWCMLGGVGLIVVGAGMFLIPSRR